MKEQMGDLWRKCCAEVMGTFVLVFAGTGAAVVDDVSHGSVSHLGVGLVWGLVVMAMIYALGETSGAHLNPAVTVGFFAVRRFPGRLLGPYVASQLLGALLASVMMRVLFPAHATLGMTLPSGGMGQSFVLEILLTAILVFVAMCVSTGSKEVGTLAGIAIGGVVGLEAIFAGPISGASMNPARSLAPAIVSGQLGGVWLYLTAPLVGALLGAGGWLIIRPARPNSTERM